MEILRYRTNVVTQEDLSRVAPYLDKEESISKWSIDIESTDKVLSISGTKLDPQTVKKVIEQAGFQAEIERVIGLNGEDL